MRACPEIAVATRLAVRPWKTTFTAALAFSSRIEGQFSPKSLRPGENSRASSSRGARDEASARPEPISAPFDPARHGRYDLTVDAGEAVRGLSFTGIAPAFRPVEHDHLDLSAMPFAERLDAGG